VLLLLVGLLAVFLADAKPGEGEEEMEGPRHLKAFVGRKGGGIRLFRELPPPPGMKGRRKTGEIIIRLGRIREIGVNGTDSDMDDDDRPGPPGSGPPPPGGQRPTPPRPPRPGIDNLDDVDFDVSNEKYVHSYILHSYNFHWH